MRFTPLFASALLLGGLGLTAGAQDLDPIAERKQRMDAVGDASRTGGQMIRGDTPFDAEVALEVFQTMNESITGFADLFPEGTEAGGETEAAPSIFERPDEFRERAEAFESATASAIQASPQTLEDFRAVFGEVSQGCRACHQDFRVRTN